jgi:hypothetical protein
MGRPIKKSATGVQIFGTYADDTGIRVDAFVGSAQVDCFIVKQKGSRRYVVQDVSAGTQAICTLVNVAAGSLTAGQMRLTGYVGGNGDAGRAIRKLTKRIATDFSSNRYKWAVVNDSTNDYIVLTPL